MKLKQIEWIDLGKHNLALLPESGEWLLLDDLSKDIISRLGEFKKISDVEREYPGLEPNEIRRLLNLLEQNKFIDDGSVVDNSCKPCNHGMPTHAVLNLTEACNLKCTYCYVNAGCNQKDFMKPETAFRIADEYSLMNPERKVNLTMHGGEPLLNFDLFKKLAAYTKDRRDQIDITMQTNATLLTDEIAQFIKENKIGVGVSIDGPAEFHNKTRPLQNGKGSFEQVMRGIRILQKHGIPFGTISVMNGQNAEHIDEIIDFFLANDIYSYSFIPLQRIGRGENDEQSYIDGETMFAAYKRIMKRIVDFNTKNKGEKRIEERFVKNLARNVFLHKKQFMCMRAPCGAGRNTMGFGINGDFYACDDFINDPDFRIGTLDGGHFKDQILKSKVVAQTEFRAMKHLSRCKDCEWRGVCGGICYSTDYYTGARGVEETETCVFYKLMIPYLIQQYDLNPDLPELLIGPMTDYSRKVVLSTAESKNCQDQMDADLFKSLLKLHSISYMDDVFFDEESLKDSNLVEYVNFAKVKNIQPKLVVLSPDSLSKENVEKALQFDNLWVRTATDNPDTMNVVIRQFAEEREKSNCDASLTFFLPISSTDAIEQNYSMIKDKLKSSDTLVLYGNNQHDDAEKANALLNRIGDDFWSTNIRLANIPLDSLSSQNKGFENFSRNYDVLKISIDNLKGEELANYFFE